MGVGGPNTGPKIAKTPILKTEAHFIDKRNPCFRKAATRVEPMY